MQAPASTRDKLWAETDWDGSAMLLLLVEELLVDPGYREKSSKYSHLLSLMQRRKDDTAGGWETVDSGVVPIRERNDAQEDVDLQLSL